MIKWYRILKNYETINNIIVITCRFNLINISFFNNVLWVCITKTNLHCRDRTHIQLNQLCEIKSYNSDGGFILTSCIFGLFLPLFLIKTKRFGRSRLECDQLEGWPVRNVVGMWPVRFYFEIGPDTNHHNSPPPLASFLCRHFLVVLSVFFNSICTSILYNM